MAVRVQLRKDAGKLGFPPDPWIRRRIVSRVLGPPDPGALACVVDHRDQIIGWGTYSPDSELCVRLLALGEAPPPSDWLARRIDVAWRARRGLGLGRGGDAASTTGYREINSEGDGLPGLVVDRYGDARVVVMTTAPMVVRRTEIAAILGALDPRPTVMIAPEAAGRREGFEAEIRHENGVIPEQLSYLEHGLRFEVPTPPAQKTGAYHDQRDNRARVASLAATTEGAFLDLGCHVGGFATHAARAGVKKVVAVDRSVLALEFAARNAEQNGVRDRVSLVEADMFGPLDAPELAGPFATIVFDPPKVASSRRDVPRAVSAMQRTTRLLLERLTPGGRLVLCSCSQHLDAVALDRVAAGAAASIGKAVARTARWGPGEDHPVAPGHPQGDYLTVHTYQPR